MQYNYQHLSRYKVPYSEVQIFNSWSNLFYKCTSTTETECIFKFVLTFSYTSLPLNFPSSSLNFRELFVITSEMKVKIRSDQLHDCLLATLQTDSAIKHFCDLKSHRL